MLGTGHAQQLHLEHVGGVADGIGHLFRPRRHAIERAMGLDVIERYALGIEERLQSAHLIDQAVGQLRRIHLHLAAAETLKIGQRRMGADLDAVLFRQPDRLVHHRRVRGMKAAGYVGDGDERHDGGIVAAFVEAEALAHVAIDCQSHMRPPDSLFRRQSRNFAMSRCRN
jgi:hypothetical protein